MQRGARGPPSGRRPLRVVDRDSEKNERRLGYAGAEPRGGDAGGERPGGGSSRRFVVRVLKDRRRCRRARAGHGRDRLVLVPGGGRHRGDDIAKVVERGVVDESRLALASPRGEVAGPLRADPPDVRGEAGEGCGFCVRRGFFVRHAARENFRGGAEKRRDGGVRGRRGAVVRFVAVRLVVVVVIVRRGFERLGGSPVGRDVRRRRRRRRRLALPRLLIGCALWSVPRGGSLHERGARVHRSLPRVQGYVAIVPVNEILPGVGGSEGGERGDDPFDPTRRGCRRHRAGCHPGHRAQHPQRGRRVSRRRLDEGEQALA